MWHFGANSSKPDLFCPVEPTPRAAGEFTLSHNSIDKDSCPEIGGLPGHRFTTNFFRFSFKHIAKFRDRSPDLRLLCLD
jgi:hypothetical protein